MRTNNSENGSFLVIFIKCESLLKRVKNKSGLNFDQKILQLLVHKAGINFGSKKPVNP